jgi:RimJ/RimL family protein N-acetyltransferase
MIKLETFNETDFDRLINWAVNEEMLVQFSGPIFKFPLTKEQLEKYLTEKRSIAFKVIYKELDEIIGHSEIYHSENGVAKLCRILIGDESFRGKGIGEKIINKLVEYCFEKLETEKVELNVYDWNKSAVRRRRKATSNERVAQNRETLPQRDFFWSRENTRKANHNILTKITSFSPN